MADYLLSPQDQPPRAVTNFPKTASRANNSAEALRGSAGGDDENDRMEWAGVSTGVLDRVDWFSDGGNPPPSGPTRPTTGQLWPPGRRES